MIHWTNKYSSVPYLDLGRSMAGADCWGLVKLVYENELGITLPSYDGCYASTEERAEIAALVGEAKGNATWHRVHGEPKVFDVAVFRQGRLDTHIGVIVAASKMLHMANGKNAAIESIESGYWQVRLTGIYRHFKRMSA